MTATTITSTGSVTVTGGLTAANGNFTVDTSGSMTAKTLTVTGSATVTGPVLIGTNTPNLASALYVGSSTTGSLGTITAGYLSVGTISANLSLQGSTTVRFLADIFANGTVTAAGFRGDGSQLTNVSATSGADTVKIVKTANQGKASDETLADDNDLKFTIAANQNWIFKITVFAQSTSAAPDIKIAISAPSDASVRFGFDAYGTTSATVDDGVSSANTSSGLIAMSANELRVIHIDGSVIGSSTAGTVGFQWAQNATNVATVTVSMGSWLEANKM